MTSLYRGLSQYRQLSQYQSAGLPPVYPATAVLAAKTLFIQVHDTSLTAGSHPMCDWLNGAPSSGPNNIRTTDYAFMLPGGYTPGTIHDFYSILTNIRRAPGWFNWLNANNGVPGTNGATATAQSAQPTSTYDYNKLTGGHTANDVLYWNPERGHTANAEWSTQATTMATALANGLALSPAVDVWWAPAQADALPLVPTIGPTVLNWILQCQNFQSNPSTFASAVAPYIAATQACVPIPKMWVQVSFGKGNIGNMVSCLTNLVNANTSLSNYGFDGICLITETPTTPTYWQDAQAFVTALGR